MAFYNKRNNSANFVISFKNDPWNDFSIFGRGYRNAAESISKMLLGQSHFSDYDAYPVLFLFRHAFELQLKNVIYKVVKLCNLKNLKDYEEKLHNNHNLIKLAEKAVQIMQLVYKDDKSLAPILNRITTTANEFHEVDPDSFAYRYPINKKGNASTPRGQRVNLISFAEHMSKLLEDLEIIDFGVNMDTDIEITKLRESL